MFDVSSYTSPQVAAVLADLAAGGPPVTGRQLERWDAVGVLRPSAGAASGPGTRRRYSFEDLVLAYLAQLSSDGGRISADRVSAIAAAFDQARGRRLEELEIVCDLEHRTWNVQPAGTPAPPASAVISLAFAGRTVRAALHRHGFGSPPPFHEIHAGVDFPQGPGEHRSVLA